MNHHPEDQAEIDHLHSEFIAVDEPNNEQVMAFQDASYALGLKRGQAHEAALQQRLNEADQRIDELRHVGLELSGTIAEYRQMPCKSLQDRMFATYDRYVKRLNPGITQAAPPRKS